LRIPRSTGVGKKDRGDCTIQRTIVTTFWGTKKDCGSKRGIEKEHVFFWEKLNNEKNIYVTSTCCDRENDLQTIGTGSRGHAAPRTQKGGDTTHVESKTWGTSGQTTVIQGARLLGRPATAEGIKIN